MCFKTACPNSNDYNFPEHYFAMHSSEQELKLTIVCNPSTSKYHYFTLSCHNTNSAAHYFKASLQQEAVCPNKWTRDVMDAVEMLIWTICPLNWYVTPVKFMLIMINNQDKAAQKQKVVRKSTDDYPALKAQYEGICLTTTPTEVLQ